MSKEHGRMKSLLMVMVVMTVGCTKANPKSCIDNHCSDPDLPFCDVDGSIGGEPNTCIAVACSPSAFEACRGDRALTCNTTGDNFDLVECEYGCSVEGQGCKTCDTPECEKHIIPRYLPTVCDELSNGSALDVSSDASLDTSNPLNCSEVVVQPDGPEICVVRHSTISIAQNRTYRATGPRVLALVADRDVTIHGIVDVSATGTMSGPGGGRTKSGTCLNGGGGGGGAHTAGAAGGTTEDGGAQNGGAAQVNPATTTILTGGTQSSVAENCAPGGAGGGLTIISCRGTLTLNGTIDAGGGGGLGSHSMLNTPPRRAAGGGSGGTVVLQAMALDITGQLYSNGGAGGGSCSGQCENGNTILFTAEPGEDALRSTTPARGGLGDQGGGIGGAGGSVLGTSPPLRGRGHVDGTGGGGGGSAGYLLTYAPAGVTPNLSPVTVSPRLEPHGTIPTN
jgi:hypothetical protein